MIKTLAIDDEPLALQQLAAYIKRIPFLELVAECHSANEAKRILEEEMIDCIFCDINMPDLDGMSFVKSLSAPPAVVFKNAQKEFLVLLKKVEKIYQNKMVKTI
ncbi:MAG: LytR/AlgR family response regulator transcription factor [Prevotella sp.]